jgi:hypothetical protein
MIDNLSLHSPPPTYIDSLHSSLPCRRCYHFSETEIVRLNNTERVDMKLVKSVRNGRQREHQEQRLRQKLLAQSGMRMRFMYPCNQGTSNIQ